MSGAFRTVIEDTAGNGDLALVRRVVDVLPGFAPAHRRPHRRDDRQDGEDTEHDRRPPRRGCGVWRPAPLRRRDRRHLRRSRLGRSGLHLDGHLDNVRRRGTDCHLPLSGGQDRAGGVETMALTGRFELHRSDRPSVCAGGGECQPDQHGWWRRRKRAAPSTTRCGARPGTAALPCAGRVPARTWRWRSPRWAGSSTPAPSLSRGRGGLPDSGERRTAEAGRQ